MKKKRLCSSCRPISAGKCRNFDGADSGAGPSSTSGPVSRSPVSTCMPVSSLTQSNCFSSVDVGTDGDGSTFGSSRDDVRSSGDFSSVASSVLVDLSPAASLPSLPQVFSVSVPTLRHVPKRVWDLWAGIYRMLFG